MVSFVAPVVATTVELPSLVGVPETVHVMAPAGAMVAGGVGVQPVTVTFAGRPVTVQVA